MLYVSVMCYLTFPYVFQVLSRLQNKNGRNREETTIGHLHTDGVRLQLLESLRSCFPNTNQCHCCFNPAWIIKF